MTTGGDNETGETDWEFVGRVTDAVAGVVNAHREFGAPHVDVALAAISAYEANPPTWLIDLVRIVDVFLEGAVRSENGAEKHLPAIRSAVPRALLVAAGIEEEG